jgi:hypothetical protein
MQRTPIALGLTTVSALIVGGLVQAATTIAPVKESTSATTLSASEKLANRAREGTNLVDVTGHFKLAGDRATFYASQGNARYGGLENLNLERIAIVVSENPDELEWCVSGQVTEYRGSNYLLISKAVLKTKLPPSERSERKPGATQSASR